MVLNEMESIESAVARHYGKAGLLDRIVDGLKATGVDLQNLQAGDLTPVEELHIGGRKATAYAVEKMALDRHQRVLDVGCGIGGAARYLAAQIGCRVTGVDLTPEYTEVARVLTNMTGLDATVSFETASALDMPFGDDIFDAALTIHVAMNIRDRPALYREIARVLKPGAVFCAFDVMKKSDDPLSFSVPWAETAQTSHLTTAQETAGLLGEAGFDVTEIDDRSQFAADFFRAVDAIHTDAPPPLGIHLLLPNADKKRRNLAHNIEVGRVAPVQILARLK